jgi:hypothetical protein
MNQFNVSLWGDEAWAATLAVKPILKIITLVAKDTSPPLYYLCLHFWMRIFGSSEIAIRSLSFLFFLGTILTVYFIGKHLWQKKNGLWAALLTFTNPFLFTYAFEGRMYALLALTATLSVYFFLKKHWWGFTLATAAALYSHHFAIFVVIFEFLWRLGEIKFWQKPIKATIKNLTDFLTIALLYLPWIYPLCYQTSLVKSGFWLGRPDLETFGQTTVKFVVGSGEELLRQLAKWLVVLLLILRKWSASKRETLFLIGWFFAPLLFTFIISQFFQPIFFDRYLLIAIPAAALILSSGQKKFSPVILALIIILLAQLNWFYFTHPTKRPFRELAQFIKTEAAELTLINYNAAAHHLWEAKYYGLKAPIYTPQLLPFYTGTALMEKQDTIATLPQLEKIGVITSASPQEVNLPGYHLNNYKQIENLSLLWMEKN